MPGAAVGHPDQQSVVVLADGDLDPRVFAIAGVHRVVDQVAQHGDHLLAGQRHVVGVGRQMGVLGDGQLDAALVGLRGLAEKQRDQRRFADIAGQPVDQPLGQLELIGRELDRLVGAAHLDHGDHGVQLVGGLVCLRRAASRSAPATS